MTAMSVQGGSVAIIIASALLRRGQDDRPDGEIVKAVLRGGVEAYRVLVHRYERRVYAVARGMLRSHDEADEVAQEAFVRAYQSLHTFDTSRAFFPWLCRITVNLAITLSQQRDRRGSDSLDEYERRAGHEAPADDDPSRVAEQRELEAAVGRALSELPDGMREVFILRTFDDLSYQEISEVLGLPKGTVMSRLARARERVRDRLGPFLETARGSDAEAGR